MTSRQAFDAKEASPEERHQSAQHQKLAKFFGEENIDYVAVSKSISVSAVKRASPPPFTSSTTQDTMPSIQRTTPAVELIPTQISTNERQQQQQQQDFEYFSATDGTKDYYAIGDDTNSDNVSMGQNNEESSNHISEELYEYDQEDGWI